MGCDDRGKNDQVERNVTHTQSGEISAPPSHHVAIYITDHCANCDYAREVARLIRTEYPYVTVAVVDLADPQETVPDAVFATPTYLLDGRLWSLGNPSPQQIREKLSIAED